MPEYKNFTLKGKSNSGQYIPIALRTVPEQIIGVENVPVLTYIEKSILVNIWDVTTKKATIFVPDGANKASVVYVMPSISMNESKDIALQKLRAYNQIIDVEVGKVSVGSGDEWVRFTAREIPEIDIPIQIWWINSATTTPVV